MQTIPKYDIMIEQGGSMPKKLDKSYDKLKLALDKLMTGAVADDSALTDEAYNILEEFFREWAVKPGSDKVVFDMVREQPDSDNIRIGAHLDFGQKEDNKIYVVLVAVYEDKVSWRTFPYDDFDEIVEEALENPVSEMMGTITVTDSIRTLSDNKWLDKVLAMPTDDFDDRITYRCRYRDESGTEAGLTTLVQGEDV